MLGLVTILCCILIAIPCFGSSQSCFLPGISSLDRIGTSARKENSISNLNSATDYVRHQRQSTTAVARSLHSGPKSMQRAPPSLSRKHNNKTACRMAGKNNNSPNYFDIKNKATNKDEEDSEQSAPKRGVFRRVRDKISSTFGSSGNNNDDTNIDNNIVAEPGYKPNALDAVRLQIAKAMSGISNMNLFQRSREEWVVACPKTRVGPGEVIPIVVNGLDIIIFASRDGSRLDAFANACPHLGSPFDLATVERKPVTSGRGVEKKEGDGRGDGCVDCIVCPVHKTAFEIQSGQVQGEWCPYPPVLGGIMVSDLLRTTLSELLFRWVRDLHVVWKNFVSFIIAVAHSFFRSNLSTKKQIL